MDKAKDTYARDRIRFLERVIFDLLEYLEDAFNDEEDEEDQELLDLKARLCAERGSV